jgi:hypothetical protein
MEQSHIKIVKSYAVTYSRQLYAEGLWLEREDLEGEFYLCCAKALKMFNSHNDFDAKFETYLISAINNKFLDIRKKLIYDARCGQIINAVGDEIAAAVENEAVSNIDIYDAIKTSYSLLSDRERTIMDDIMMPPEAIEELIPEGCSPRKYQGHLQRAIAEVRGYHMNEVKYSIKRIRDKVKYCLPK